MKKNYDFKTDLEGFKKLFRSAPDLMAVSTLKEGRYLEVNDCFLKTLGYTRAEVIGHTSKELGLFADGYDVRREYVKELKKEGRLRNKDLKLMTKSGKILHTLLSADIMQKNFLFMSAKDVTELRNVEAKFHNVFEHSSIGKSLTDINGQIHVNQSFCDMLGYSKKELVNKKWQDITPPEDIATTKKYVALLKNGKKTNVRFEKRYIKKDGSIIWVDLSTHVERDKGKPLFFITDIIDITARKEMEQNLIASEDKYRKLIDYSILAFANHELILDAKGRPVDYTFLDVNPAFERLTGLKREELINKRVTKALPGTEKSGLIEIYGKVVLTGKSIRVEKYFEPLKKYYDITAYKTGLRTFAVVFDDITERKLLEKKSSEDEQRYKGLLENTLNAVVVYTAINNGQDFIIKYFNKAAERIERIKRAEVLGQKVTKVFPGVKAFGLFQVFQDVYKSGKPTRHPVSIYEDNRVSGWKENYVYKIPNGEIVAIYNDLTKEKQIEERLKYTENQFRDLSESALDIIQSVDEQGKFIYVNQAWINRLGYSLEEAKKMAFIKIIRKDFHSHCQQMFEQLMKGVPLSNQEVIFVSKSGEEIHVQGNITSKFVNGKFVETRGIFRDITERKNAEKEILSKNQDLEKFNSFAIDRELKMIELKKEINELLKKLGQSPKYNKDDPTKNNYIKDK